MDHEPNNTIDRQAGIDLLSESIVELAAMIAVREQRQDEIIAEVRRTVDGARKQETEIMIRMFEELMEPYGWDDDLRRYDPPSKGEHYTTKELHAELASKTLQREMLKNSPRGRRARDRQRMLAKAKAFPVTSLLAFRRGVARCVWHTEKTASLKYYPKDNHVYCFGCHRHGSAVDVAMALFKLEFREAVDKLSTGQLT